ncbi:hypothetical protein PFICI_15068 [Pestalotiopsis fici W106-1]|uniref:Alpha N-terminal protein methyltransferase 1 n=1 Tax=Pestalotiopsis fici (strain W106-1 / CGMCC3.15140) TaxID=1229662 RepID=W3WGU9_PESFW|nr:uncharacterized protein PFICI_15068 [Pestalotiopsis fici W106-1]ETS73123.1 hypothetical protein PFICI_15068 [Pestalotiopsis fici W106-1]
MAEPSDLPGNTEGSNGTRKSSDHQTTALSPNKDVGLGYWNNVECNVDGMLGGFSVVSRIDLQSSRNFLAKLGIGAKPGLRVVDRALEGGAGIGRVTEGLLLKVAKTVDIIEPVIKFTDTIKGKDGVCKIHNVGLEEWRPTQDDQYDLIWTQWCVGHLSDAQLLQYLKECKSALKPGTGLAVVKENLSTIDVDMFDEIDSSITRRDDKFRSLFAEAGLAIVRTELQKGFPKSNLGKLLPVRVYALKPVSSAS